MKKLNEEKGITLVALIITIVVLLILAVVAIGAVQDSNIIGHAQNAAGGYNQAKTNEMDTMNSYEEIINEVISNTNKSDELDIDETEKIRQAWENLNFKGDSTGMEEIFKNGGYYWFAFVQEEPFISVDVIEVNGKMYSYYTVHSDKTVEVLDSNNQYYSIAEQFKTDLVKVRNTFLGNNIENFEQEKTAEEDIWKLKNIESLGVEELEIKVLSDRFQFAYNGIVVDYELRVDNLTEEDGKLTGKITELAQDL